VLIEHRADLVVAQGASPADRCGAIGVIAGGSLSRHLHDLSTRPAGARFIGAMP